MENIEKLPVNSISIYDSGFPSYALMFMMNNQQETRRFIIRAKLSFNIEVKEYVQSEQNDCYYKFISLKDAIKQLYGYEISVVSTTAVKVRMVKVLLDNGVTELLLTNLYNDKKFETDSFKELYFRRWGIETSFCSDKNILYLEEFSGQSVKSIEQDFQVTSFFLNLQRLIKNNANQRLKK